jgi:hypothetical protein
MCAEDSQLIYQPHECAAATIPRHEEERWQRNWHPSKGLMIAFGILKFVLITALVCCCVRKCRRCCKERCQQWRERHCGQGGCHNNSNSNGANVAVQPGCNYVGTTEEQQLQQALANSMNQASMPVNQQNSNLIAASAPMQPQPIHVTVNMPSSDRKDNNNSGVEMHAVNPNAVYPSLKTNKAGYTQLQQADV